MKKLAKRCEMICSNYVASQWGRWDLNPGSLDPENLPHITLYLIDKII